MTRLLSVLALTLFALPLLAHEPLPSRVEIRPLWTGPQTAGQVKISFELYDKETKKILTDRDLEVVHEKLLHVFMFDPSLRTFDHVHPDYVSGKWTVEAKLPYSGNHWVWAQGKIPGEDGDEFTSSVRLLLENGPSHPLPVPPVLEEKRVGQDGRSVARISPEKLRARRMAMPILTLERSDGTKPDIKPWLGAKAHVVAVTSDGDGLLHVHPMEHPGHGPALGPNQLMLHMFFPAAGDYRAWVQFEDEGILRTVPLNLKVHP